MHDQNLAVNAVIKCINDYGIGWPLSIRKEIRSLATEDDIQIETSEVISVGVTRFNIHTTIQDTRRWVVDVYGGKTCNVRSFVLTHDINIFSY